MEALGLVTRLRCPELVRIVDWRLSAIDPELVGYFWHGVGRGLYFLPLNALPCASSSWRAVGDGARRGTPHLGPTQCPGRAGVGRDPGQYQASGDSGGFLETAWGCPICKRCVCQWCELRRS